MNKHIRKLFGALKDPKLGTPLKVLNLTPVSIDSLKVDIESSKWRYISLEKEKMLLNLNF